MIVFRCSRCSKVNISAEAHRCLHCGNEEARVSTTPENQKGVRITSTGNDAFLHVQNRPTGIDLTDLPEAIEKLSVQKLTQSDGKDKDIKTLNVNRSPICSSQEKSVSPIAQNSILKEMLISTSKSTCRNSADNGRHYPSTKYDASTPKNKLLHISKQSSGRKSKNNLREKKMPKHNKMTKSIKNKIAVGKLNLGGSSDFSPEKSILDSFAKNNIDVKQAESNQDKTNSSSLSSKGNNSFKDDLKIAKEISHHSASEVSLNGCSKNDFNDKVLIKRIKIPPLQKLFLCNKCGKDFVDESKFKRHFFRHFEEKRFKCDRCDKKYFSEAHLKRHYNAHMDKGLFKCDLCDLAYTRRCHLSRHRKKHILELAEDEVDDNTTQQKMVQSSQQTDQGAGGDDNPQKDLEASTEEKILVCSHCGAKFIHESDFNAHSLRHSEQNPFKCNKCNKEFRYEFYLNRHCRIHTLERPFTCEICGFTSTQKSNINKHLKVHA